jgi:hypothetical protein
MPEFWNPFSKPLDTLWFAGRRMSDILMDYYLQGKGEGQELGLSNGWSKGWDEGWAEGRLRGLRQALLKVLSARALGPTPAQRKALLACDDLPRLERLLDAALGATTIEEALTNAGEPMSDACKQAYREGQAAGEARGKAQGLITALLRVFYTRPFFPEPEEYEEIHACQDLARLEFWVGEAVRANGVFAALHEVDEERRRAARRGSHAPPR